MKLHLETYQGEAPSTIAVRIEELQLGMMPSVDVTDQNGRLLVPAGTSLTERHLRAFEMWGVTEIRVQASGSEPPEPAPAPLTPEQLAHGAEAVRSQFALVNLDHPVLAELFGFVAFRAAQRLWSGRRHA